MDEAINEVEKGNEVSEFIAEMQRADVSVAEKAIDTLFNSIEKLDPASNRIDALIYKHLTNRAPSSCKKYTDGREALLSAQDHRQDMTILKKMRTSRRLRQIEDEE